MGQTPDEIDLRLFPDRWRAAHALVEPSADRVRRSIQIFDAHGEAVHKMCATGATDLAAFDALTAALAAPEAPAVAFAPAPPPMAEQTDAESFRAAWRALEHGHDFFPLLRRFGVTRAEALRPGAPEFARPVAASTARAALTAAAEAALPVMIFVGNRGCMQIHSGRVRRIEATGPWLNVLDPRLNLHLREDRIAAAWVVRKPSARGDAHALELFDAAGFSFCQIFGERPAGAVEREDWRALVAALPEAGAC